MLRMKMKIEFVSVAVIRADLSLWGVRYWGEGLLWSWFRLSFSDVDTPEPDEKSLITYISQLYQIFPEPPSIHPLFNIVSDVRFLSLFCDRWVRALFWIKSDKHRETRIFFSSAGDSCTLPALTWACGLVYHFFLLPHFRLSAFGPMDTQHVRPLKKEK